MNCLYSGNFNARPRLMNICYTILYSKDSKDVAKAYNMFFTQYKQMIMTNADAARISCVEDVILKVVDEGLNKDLSLLGKNDPFLNFLVLVRDQERYSSTVGRSRKWTPEYIKKYPLAKLKNYILLAASTTEDYEAKREYIKKILHQCYTKITN